MKVLKMILASKRSELTNLAHYWRRIARHKKAQKHKSFSEMNLRVAFLFLCLLWLARNEAFAKLARSGAGGDAEGFGEVTAAEIADAGADLCYGEIGFRE
jgi:hypothetical protein